MQSASGVPSASEAPSARKVPSIWRGATVAEYGIGGGLLGQYLLTSHNISRYLGIDIAERQLRAARRRLEGCCRGQYELLQVECAL